MAEAVAQIGGIERMALRSYWAMVFCLSCTLDSLPQILIKLSWCGAWAFIFFQRSPEGFLIQPVEEPLLKGENTAIEEGLWPSFYITWNTAQKVSSLHTFTLIGRSILCPFGWGFVLPYPGGVPCPRFTSLYPLSSVFSMSEGIAWVLRSQVHLLSASHSSVTLMWFRGSGYLSRLKDEEPLQLLFFVALEEFLLWLWWWLCRGRHLQGKTCMFLVCMQLQMDIPWILLGCL